MTHTVDQQFKIEEHVTEFEKLVTRFHLTEDNCTENPEVVAWVTAHRNSRWVPEKILRKLTLATLFDEGEQLAPYTLTQSGVVVEPATLQEIEEVGDEQTPQDQAARA